MINKFKKKNLFFYLVILLIFSVKFNFFLNIYIILKNNSETRLVSNYGYCSPQGYGFIKEMNKKYDLNYYNINTRNKIISPSSNIFNFSYNKKKSPYEILINFKSNNLDSIKNKFEIIEYKEECYLIKYLDG